MKKITIVSAIIVSALIIAIAILVIDSNKRKEEKFKEDFARTMLNLCIDDANSSYWSYMELNGEKNDDGTIWALTHHWDYADQKKESDIDLCFKRYK